MEQKEMYDIGELFDFLPITLAELARRSKLNEVTLARIRDGKRTRRDTVNKLLMTFSQIYEINVTIKNVTGINVMQNRRLEAREQKVQSNL
jgi:predicted transcriptional regulator